MVYIIRVSIWLRFLWLIFRLVATWPYDSIEFGFLSFTVVLVENGEVFSFGNNTHGQLGNGGVSSRDYPVKVPFCNAQRDPSSIAALSDRNGESSGAARDPTVSDSSATAAGGKASSLVLMRCQRLEHSVIAGADALRCFHVRHTCDQLFRKSGISFPC